MTLTLAITRDDVTSLEAAILAANGGRPWNLDDIMAVDLNDARQDYAYARTLVGFKFRVGQWMTGPGDNDKLGKADGAAAGITYSPATELADVVASDATDRDELANILGLTVDQLRRWALRLNPCPHATAGCTGGCVIRTAGKGTLSSVQRGRSARSLTLAVASGSALRLTADAIIRHARKYPTGTWRWAVGDDIRIEVVAPGLLMLADALGLAQYAYTKWGIAARPDIDGLTFVRSATKEGGRWSAQTVIDAARLGHNVAVVVDVPRGAPLPTHIGDVPVVDGDATDNRTIDPVGCLVLLRSKGALVGKAIDPNGFVFTLAELFAAAE